MECLVNNRIWWSTRTQAHCSTPAKRDWESCMSTTQWSLAKAHFHLLCRIHFPPPYGLRTTHQFWCLTARYTFSWVYVGSWAQSIRLLFVCSRPETPWGIFRGRQLFHAVNRVPKVKEMIMLRQKHLLWKSFSILHMQAIHLKKAQNIEGSLGVAAALLDFSCQLHMFLANHCWKPTFC